MKHHSYIICRASGQIEKCKVPIVFPFEAIAQKLEHSIVILLATGRNKAIPAYIVKPDGTAEALHTIPKTKSDFARLDYFKFNQK